MDYPWLIIGCQLFTCLSVKIGGTRYKRTGSLKWMKWNSWNKVKHVVSICLIPFQPLQWACPPIAPPTSLHWNLYTYTYLNVSLSRVLIRYPLDSTAQKVGDVLNSSGRMHIPHFRQLRKCFRNLRHLVHVAVQTSLLQTEWYHVLCS